MQYNCICVTVKLQLASSYTWQLMRLKQHFYLNVINHYWVSVITSGFWSNDEEKIHSYNFCGAWRNSNVTSSATNYCWQKVISKVTLLPLKGVTIMSNIWHSLSNWPNTAQNHTIRWNKQKHFLYNVSLFMYFLFLYYLLRPLLIAWLVYFYFSWCFCYWSDSDWCTWGIYELFSLLVPRNITCKQWPIRAGMNWRDEPPHRGQFLSAHMLHCCDSNKAKRIHGNNTSELQRGVSKARD